MHRGVVAKLLLFTAAMIVAPLASYFLTVDRVFNGRASLKQDGPNHRSDIYRQHNILGCNSCNRGKYRPHRIRYRCLSRGSGRRYQKEEMNMIPTNFYHFVTTVFACYL